MSQDILYEHMHSRFSPNGKSIFLTRADNYEA